MSGTPNVVVGTGRSHASQRPPDEFVATLGWRGALHQWAAQVLFELEGAVGAPGWEQPLMERNEYAVSKQLDQIRITVEFRRDLPGNPVDLFFAGSSRKGREPLFVETVREDDPRNVSALVGGWLNDVVYYRPTSAKDLHRIVDQHLREDETLPLNFPLE